MPKKSVIFCIQLTIFLLDRFDCYGSQAIIQYLSNDFAEVIRHDTQKHI